MTTYRNAREFLAEVDARYRALTSYSDVGLVSPSWKPEPLSCWFETQYKNTGQFRFQFIRPHPYKKLRHLLTKYIAGTDGNVAYFVREKRGEAPVVEIEESLEMAVAGATGISQGTAHTIGGLLLECMGGSWFSRLERPRFRSSRDFDNVACFRVSGIFPAMGRYTLWIGAQDMLLRKVVIRTAYPRPCTWERVGFVNVSIRIESG